MQGPSRSIAKTTARAILSAIALLALGSAAGQPARAADADCSALAALLASGGPLPQRIESARQKLSSAPACGYLIADAARTGLPAGAARTRIVDEALEASRDWVPAMGQQRIGYLKAAILAGSDTSLALPKWRDRVEKLMVEYSNLTSRREIAELETNLSQRYEVERKNPFAIADCARLPAVGADLARELAAGCRAREVFLAACEALRSTTTQITGQVARRCAESLRALGESYPQAESHATVAAVSRRLSELMQAEATRVAARTGQASVDTARAEQQRRLERDRAEEGRRAQAARAADDQLRQREATERSRIAGLDTATAARETLALFDSRARPSFDCQTYAQKDASKRTPAADLLCISPDRKSVV